MSNSYKKTPITGQCSSRSSKWYKRIRHGQERAKEKELLAHGDYDNLDAELAPFDDWSDPRDGRFWMPRLYNREQIKKRMRK